MKILPLSEIESLQSLSSSELASWCQKQPRETATWALRVLNGQRTETTADWAETISPSFIRARHHELINTAIEDALRGIGPPLVVVEIPVRHGKSLFLSQYFTSSYLCRNPSKQVILVSATQRLAERWSRKSRAVFERWAPVYYGVGIHKDKSASGDWETTKGGGMLAAGVGGDIVGRDGNLIVVDDYIRRSSDALSQSVRDSQWDWFQSTLAVRMEPNAVMVVLATRWHRDDLIGRITAKDEGEGEQLMPYRRIKLPAIATENDELGRQPGEALWPERWPLGEVDRLVPNSFGQRVVGLRKRKAGMDPSWWDALYQQEPPREGLGQWPDSYFEEMLVEDMPTAALASIASIDLAEGKTAKAGDFSVCTGIHVGHDGRAYVECLLLREAPEAFFDRVLLWCVERRIFHLVIEAQQYSSLIAGAVEDAITKTPGAEGIQIELIRNVTEKLQRIQRLGAYFARQQLRIKDDMHGRTLLSQLRDFPHGRHDDGPDALEMALRFLPDAVRSPQHGGVTLHAV